MNEQSPTLFDTSKPPEPDPRPVLFLDQTFSSQKLAALLRAAPEWRIELHGDHFDSDEKDHVWISVVAQRGWLILSCDKRIKKWQTEGGLARRAAVESRAKIFFCGRGGRPLADYGYDVGHARHQMLRLVKQNRGPLFARVMRGGKVQTFFLERPKTKRDRTRAKYGDVI